MKNRRLFLLGVLLGLLVIFLAASGRVLLAMARVVQTQGNLAVQSLPTDATITGLNQLPPMAPAVVLVGLKPDSLVSTNRLDAQVGIPSLDLVLSSLGVQSVEPVFSGTGFSLSPATTGDALDISRIYRLRLSPETNVLQAAQALSANPSVAFAEPDFLAHIITSPNDTYYPGQWGLAKIDAPAAWDVITGTSNIVIAIVDSGLDTAHPDLASQLWTNPGEIAGNSFDDDNNGYIDDIHGWNFADNNTDLSDTTGHGTQVAGVVAAATNNSVGIAGMCWNCQIMIIKVVQSGGVANYSDIAAGVAYAAQKGADVINLSLGGYSDSATLRTAIAAASQTAVVIGGAGNNDTSSPFYPAAYDDYVLAVAGTTITDTKVGTSNYGTWVDVAAPGEAITTTFDGDGYGSSSGTSMAAPFVSGLAGLLRSQHSDWSPNQVRAHIIHTANNIDSLNPGFPGLLGNGRINAGQAISTPAVPELSMVSYSINGVEYGRPAAGSSVILMVMLRNDWGRAINATGVLESSDPYVSNTQNLASFDSIGTYEVKQNLTPFTFSVSPSAPYAHAMPFSLTVEAAGGFQVVLPLTITTKSGVEPVSGPIVSDTTWTNDRSYLVTGNVLVPEGITLAIQPGTVVRFNTGTSLLMGGTLIADGTESQAILFTSAQSNPAPGDWGIIKFTETAMDAAVDGNGDYLSGSVIRYATIEYGQGVEAYVALPYFSHDKFYRNSGSALSRTTQYDKTRSGTLMIRNSEFIENTGNGVNVSHIYGTKSITISNNHFLRNGGAGMQLTLYNCEADLNISSNYIFQNRGGIRLNNYNYGPCDDFLIENNVIADSSGAYGAGSGLELSQVRPIVRHNIFANHDSTGANCSWGPCSVIWSDDFSAPYVISNTFVGNKVDTLVCLNCNYGQRVSGPYLSNNWDIDANEADYIFKRGGSVSQEIPATNNYWGITNTTQINQLIYDYYDDLNPGKVLYQPVLTAPDPTAPAYLWRSSITPNTVGIQQATFELTFSAPMDQSTNPIASFGSAAPYTTFLVSDNAQWLNDRTWQATYDVTSLVPRGTYTVSVSGAKGLDGMEIPTDTRFGFAVDYAGTITDQTPPPHPSVTATGKDGDPSTVEATWIAIDPESPITGYRYAIGSAPGATDIVNWTTTSSTSMSRDGLGLVNGRLYWVAVQARNAGGLWSVSGYSSFFAGGPLFKIFLTLVVK